MIPDQFIHNGTTYNCVGADEGKYWTDDIVNGFHEAVGFDQSDCKPRMKDPTHFMEVWGVPDKETYTSDWQEIDMLPRYLQKTKENKLATIAIWKIKMK